MRKKLEFLPYLSKIYKYKRSSYISEPSHSYCIDKMCKHFGSVPKAVKVTIERIFLLLWVKYISFFKSKKKSETNEKIEEMSKE